MHFVGVLNRDGGTFRTMDMEAFTAHAVEVFAAHGHSLDCRVVEGTAVASEIEQAAVDPTTEAILAGGGDGTISTAASICFRARVPLAVLPAGTMNLFARSLQVPPRLEDALAALAGGEVRAVDIATANGKPFVHQYSVGIHPRLVKIRESLAYRGRWGKMWASIRAIIGTVARPPRFRAEIRTGRRIDVRTLSGISVSNNILGEGHVPYADDLTGGVLGVYVVEPMPAWELAKLCIKVLVGTWKAHPQVSEKEVEQITLSFPKRKRSAQAVIDGELIELEQQVDLRAHPGALKVVAPLVVMAVAA
jgi:diacylglycerol kinase family enzyme